MSSETISSSTATRIRQNISTMPSPWAKAPIKSWKKVGHAEGYSNCRKVKDERQLVYESNICE